MVPGRSREESSKEESQLPREGWRLSGQAGGEGELRGSPRYVGGEPGDRSKRHTLIQKAVFPA